jgi:hypothetical protein
MDVFYAKHVRDRICSSHFTTQLRSQVIRIVPMPAEVKAAFDWIEKDPTVYFTMSVPSFVLPQPPFTIYI